jgi:hypothetical protein
MQAPAAVGCIGEIRFHSAKGMEATVGKAKELADVIEHDNPPQR